MTADFDEIQAASLKRQPQGADMLASLAPPEDAPLSVVQEWMARLVVQNRSLHKSAKMQAAAALHFSGNDRLSPAQQVDIYRQQFLLRHTSFLIDDFPGVSGLLGQKAWEQVIEGYLTTRAPLGVALRDLGARLPEHLASLSGEFYRDLQVEKQLLVDMAHLECAYLKAFDAADDPALSSEKLARIPAEKWPMARLRTSNSLTLLRVTYPINSLRRALLNDRSSVDAKSVQPQPAALVIYRRDFALYDKALSEPAFLLLEELTRGTRLVPACEKVVEREPSAAAVFDQQLTDWFAWWGRLGWIVDVEVV